MCIGYPVMLVIYKATYRLICGRPTHKSEHELKKIPRTIKHNALPYHCLALKSKLANPDMQVIYKATTGRNCRNPSARPRINSKKKPRTENINGLPYIPPTKI